MRVVAILTETVAAFHAQRSVYLVRGHHTVETALVAQPEEVCIGRAVQAARCDNAGQLVVVNWERADTVVGGRERIESFRVPSVLIDDFLSCLREQMLVDQHVAANAPAGVAARPGFLRQRQRNALIKGTRNHGPFAISAAACDCDAGRVDVQLWIVSEHIDDATGSPCPCHQGTGGGVGAVEVVEKALSAAGGTVLRANSRVVK